MGMCQRSRDRNAGEAGRTLCIGELFGCCFACLAHFSLRTEVMAFLQDSGCPLLPQTGKLHFSFSHRQRQDNRNTNVRDGLMASFVLDSSAVQGCPCPIIVPTSLTNTHSSLQQMISGECHVEHDCKHRRRHELPNNNASKTDSREMPGP